MGQPPLDALKVFALLKEDGQFFEDGVWTNTDRGMACAAAPPTPPTRACPALLLRRSSAPRLCKNYAWAVDASNRQAPVPAHLADYRLALGHACQGVGRRKPTAGAPADGRRTCARGPWGGAYALL